MIFSCEKQILAEAVSTVMKAAVNKSTLPVLEGLLIRSDEDTIIITANNLELGIECRIPAHIREDGVFVTGDAKVFFEIIRKLPSGMIDITVQENFSVTIQNGKSIYSILGVAPEEFPELPRVLENVVLTIDAITLKKMIQQTVYAAAQKNEKPILTGVLFEIEDEYLYMVALDGFRMSIRKEAIPGQDEDFIFIVPAKTLSELSRILPDEEEQITVRLTDKHVFFEFGSIKVVSRLISGEYFQYKQIIPKDFRIKLQLPVADILSCVERADPIVALDVYKNPVIMTIQNDTLAIDCVTAVGKAHDVIEIPNCNSEIRIGFNQRYLHDALSACEGEEIIMEFNGNKNPCIIRPAAGDAYLFMVLPVRISEE
ncbi:MAG: DNA polymerase III subunit beta [Clostridia bacterium]|nr:DNA polymerase III subunit beta [Clostridia bacterium]